MVVFTQNTTSGGVGLLYGYGRFGTSMFGYLFVGIHRTHTSFLGNRIVHSAEDDVSLTGGPKRGLKLPALQGLQIAVFSTRWKRAQKAAVTRPRRGRLSQGGVLACKRDQFPLAKGGNSAAFAQRGLAPRCAVSPTAAREVDMVVGGRGFAQDGSTSRRKWAAW